MKGDRPTEELRAALNRLLERNDYTAGAEVGELYMGKDIVVVRLRRPKVIEGECRDVEKTMDLFDLMAMHERATGER